MTGNVSRHGNGFLQWASGILITLTIFLFASSSEASAQVLSDETDSARDGAHFSGDDGASILKIEEPEARKLLAEPLPQSPVAAYAVLQRQEQAARKLGDRARQLEILYKIVEKSPARPARDRWRMRLASVEFDYGSQGRAAELIEKWLDEHDLSDEARAMLCLRLTVFYIQASDRVRGEKAWSRAQDPLQRARANPSANHERLVYLQLIARGEIERIRGDLQASVNSFLEAVIATRRNMEVQLKRAKGDASSEDYLSARAENNGALALSTYALVRVSRHVEAAAVAEEGLRLAQIEKRGIEETGRWHYRLSNVLLATRAYAKALLHARSAERLLTEAGASGASQTMWLARRDQLFALLALRRFAEADRVYAAALAAMPSDALARNRASDLRLQTILAAKNGRFDEALNLIEGNLKSRSRFYGDKHPLTLEARGVRGLAHLLAGNPRRAVWDYEELFSATLDKPSGWVDLNLGGFRGYTFAIAFEEYLRYVADVYQKNGSVDEKLVDRALQIVDRMNLTVTQEALIDSTARLLAANPELQKALADEQAQRQLLRERYRELSTALAQESREKKDMTEAERKAIRDDIKAKREAIEPEQTKLAALREDIARKFPAYADLATPSTPSPTALQKLLGPGEALIMIHPGDYGTMVWAITPAGKTAFHVGSSTAEEIGRQVTVARRTLDLSANPEAPMPSGTPAVLYDLYRDLLKPLEPAFKNAQSLIIATQGPLASLPFAAFITAQPEAGKAPEWLIQKLAISHVPTSSSLLALRRGAGGAAAPRPMIGFGDPVFDPAKRRTPPGKVRRIVTGQMAASDIASKPASAENAAVVKSPSKNKPAASRTPGAASAPGAATSFDIERGFRYANMPDLPETRAELLALAAALGADPKQDLYLGERATRNAVLQTDLSDRRVVAFATHGLMPGDIPGVSKPSLALSAVGAKTSGQPSMESPLLTLDDVLSLRLNAQWVVLSACNTAAGEMNGSAMSGLVRGFFFVGARSVLATHWSVESASAEALVTDTFRRAAGDPTVARAASLREAQLAMIDGRLGDGKWRHPFYWAPYSLFGDPAR